MGERSSENVGDRPPREERGQTRITTSIGGSVSGEVVIGDRNTTIHTSGPAASVSEAELAELRQAFDALKAEVAGQAPPDKRAAALEHLDELHDAMTVGKPKLSTMEYVRDWFVKNIPTMAGAVTAIVVNPIVGKLVQAGGDALVGEFKHRFGPGG